MASQASKPQLLSGARGVVKYVNSDGKQITLGIATDISINTRENLRPSYVIGEIGPVSIEPLSFDVDCSLGRLVPVNLPQSTEAIPGRDKTATTPSIPNSPGGRASATTALDLGLEERIDQILTAASIEILVFDKQSDKPVCQIKEARFTGRSLSVGTGDVAQERLNFVGIYDAANGNTPEETGY